MLPGWNVWYRCIVAEFGYSPQQDAHAAALLAGMLTRPPPADHLTSIMYGKGVICAGAGESLLECLPYITKSSMPCVAADSALPPLLQYGILPDVVVTDLDGDLESLYGAAGKGSVIVVHAHGDNIGRLNAVRRLPGCMGTSQTTPVGYLQNYGGFTDGDRAAFLANRFGAHGIILCGMDLGGPITKWSNSTPHKLHKLRVAARLLEWMAESTTAALYTVSYPLRGFYTITPDQIPRIAPPGHAKE